MQLKALLHFRGLAIASAIALAVTATACGGGDRPATGDVSSGAPDGAVIVAARDNEFSPESLELPAGATSVSVTNTGDAAHNFVIEELNVSTGTIEPGATVTARFDLPVGGAEFICTFHGAMKGRISAANAE